MVFCSKFSIYKKKTTLNNRSLVVDIIYSSISINFEVEP